MAIDQSSVLDISKWPTAQKFVARCAEFLNEVQDLTPGKDLEARLNSDYGPGNAYYEDFCSYIRQGLKEGWVAETELDGPRYRRGRITMPTAETRYFSITTVYMDSQEEYSGQYHAHPYGEINCVVQIDEGAELKGMQGWQGAGWTSPGPGTHHYPQVRGGALVALFFLPAGRISYNAKPGWHGLVMAKTYREAYPESSMLILDYAESIGGTWAQERIYPGLKTNNVVGSYEFSDFPLVPKHYGIKAGQHIPGAVVHRYLSDAAKYFDFASDIRLRTRVESATLLPDGSWQIDYYCRSPAASIVSPPSSTHTSDDYKDPGHRGQIHASKLVLATGLTSEPFMPPLSGRDAFRGPIFHAKDFRANAETLSRAGSVVIIGGNKSAWDVSYSAAAHFGAKAHMLMRRSGGGPSWVWPARLPGFFPSLSALTSTRFVSWLDPSPFGPSATRVRRFIHRSRLGRALVSLFWSRLDDQVRALNAYDQHPATALLRPWTSTYWMGNSLSIHNYETSWFDLAREGKIVAHAAEVVSLSERTVHLSDGTSIIADAVVCCTGWEARPNIKFLPEGVEHRIGFPGEGVVVDADHPSLEAQARSKVLRWAPELRQPPIRTLPNDLLLPECERFDDDRKTSQPIYGRSCFPYRLYRFVVPYDREFIQRRNLAIIGAHITIHTAILSQAQALWITAFLDGKISHLTGGGRDGKPDFDKIKQETFYHTEFERIRRPREAGGAGDRYPDLVVDSIPYVDLLLSDLRLPYHRKKNWYKEMWEPYQVGDYKGLVREWKELRR
ncbi:hypothetical protein VTK73DRAFT_5047 [Phialemonium thermophilum]|uniref:L-ornithine N(5)-monooxygenase [NAD(P)H] n=1 Tax=Phialemonium thermophilum TaxID=223376 RepID=A0ABR3WQT4_9PEZI